MDWISDFTDRFSNFVELQGIKEKRLHGSLTINFSDGVAQNYDLKIHRKYENQPSIERRDDGNRR